MMIIVNKEGIDYIILSHSISAYLIWVESYALSPSSSLAFTLPLLPPAVTIFASFRLHPRLHLAVSLEFSYIDSIRLQVRFS